MSKLIRDAMTRRLITVPKGTTVAKALQTMDENNFRHLPVVDSKNDIIGILSNRDFLRAGELENMRVETMMSSPVFSIDEKATLKKGVNVMLQKKISSLIVLDSKEMPVGILTTDDILEQYAKVID